jgi:hypothetical protein
MTVKGSLYAFVLNVKRYVRENWGAPFIVAFMVFLVVAAVSMSTGLDALADDVAVYAYYALIGGVVLQLVCFLKFRGKGGDEVS